MEIDINEEKLSGKVTLFLNEYNNFDDMISEIFTFDDKNKILNQNINEYLRVFSDKKYEISHIEKLESEVDTEFINIKFPIK